jgi:hypothetical protein
MGLQDLDLVKQERTLLGTSEFAKLVMENVPADIVDEFTAAFDS